MKKVYLLFGLIVFSQIFGQIPAGYYDSANGLTGAALKTALSKIITDGHRDNGYGGLWAAYYTTDVDKNYENDGTVLDIYSENPAGADPYNYRLGTNQCGSSFSAEGDCYNREHIVPQSLFNERSPMVSDVHFIRATDGKVNGLRSNYPFGVVSTITTISKNGSKLGVSGSPGYNGTVFEPINEFKGDVARMVFYFVTRYESQLSTFQSGNMLGGSAYPGLEPWELNVLLNWAASDPVSPAEINRNNASYEVQGNRNPYIDHPEYVAQVWGTSMIDTEVPTAPSNLAVTATTSSSATVIWSASTDNVGISGYIIYVNGVQRMTVGNVTTATIMGLASDTTYSITVKAVDGFGNVSSASNAVEAKTAAGTSTGTCVSETFSKMPSASSSYSERKWVGDNISWTATGARTDQTIDGPAITIKDGYLKSGKSANGIGILTVTTQLKFNGTASDLVVKLNGNDAIIAKIPYSAQVQTVSIPINIAGEVEVSIINPSTENRVAIDNLSWTCYSSTLATADAKAKDVHIYPNPVRNGEIFINGLKEKTEVQIYNASGQLVLKTSADATHSKISAKHLSKGLYILKAGNFTQKIIIE